MPGIMIVQIVKEYVINACSNPLNVFGTAFFEQHLLVVHEYSQQLARHVNADPEILEIAAYLHDIAAIQDFSAVSKHHLRGAEIAVELLARHHYPAASIHRVAQCIRSHSAPVQPGDGSNEEVCLSQADAMSQIARPAYWLYYTYQVRHYDFEQGRDWLRKRIDQHWKALIPPAKALIEPAYTLMNNLLQPGGSRV